MPHPVGRNEFESVANDQSSGLVVCRRLDEDMELGREMHGDRKWISKRGNAPARYMHAVLELYFDLISKVFAHVLWL
jgi:hypothetical protein